MRIPCRFLCLINLIETGYGYSPQLQSGCILRDYKIEKRLLIYRHRKFIHIQKHKIIMQVSRARAKSAGISNTLASIPYLGIGLSTYEKRYTVIEAVS